MNRTRQLDVLLQEEKAKRKRAWNMIENIRQHLKDEAHPSLILLTIDDFFARENKP